MRRGLIGAGSFIVDRVYTVDRYPEEQTLANIRSSYMGGGGGAFNVLSDLAILGADFPLEAVGHVGTDEAGEYLATELTAHRVDTSGLRTTSHLPTATTLVMVADATGKRTFFHQRGANALLSPADFEFSNRSGCHLHLAYLYLLDALDAPDPEFGTAAARVLAEAKRAGLTTSVDLVSAEADDFDLVVGPALKYADLIFMNELEATYLTGVDLSLAGAYHYVHPGDVREIMARLESEYGIRGTVALHWPDGSVACCSMDVMWWQGAVEMPRERIASVVGCGDAFAAGYLLGFMRKQSAAESLRLGVCAAAACATGYTCTSGLLPEAECVELGRYGFLRCP